MLLATDGTDETQIRNRLFLDNGFDWAQSSEMKPRLSNRQTAALTLVEVMLVILVLVVVA